MTSPADLSSWHGISIGQLWTGGGIWAGLIAMGTYWVRGRPAMRKMRIEADESLRKELLERLALVEKSAEERVEKLETKLEKQRLEYETRIATERAKFDKEMAIMRHRANNLAQCVDAMLLLIEAAPLDAGKHVVKIKEMRDRQVILEAAEKGEFADDKIRNAGVPPLPIP